MVFKKYLKVMAAACFLCLFFVAFVSYFGDRGCLFHHRDKVKEVLEMLEKGHAVTNVGDIDTRQFQIQHAKACNDPIDVLVLGSSRSMNITQSMFPMKKLWNAGVGSASLEDLWYLYHMQDTPPVSGGARPGSLDVQRE